MEFVKATTSDKLILQGLLSEPTTKSDSIILHIHGMSSNFWENSFVKTMLSYYPKQNLSFLTVETRGSEIIRWFNKTDETQAMLGNAYELFEDCVNDIAAWVEFLENAGYKKIYLQGHSLGCSKIAYYQALKKSKSINALIFISPSDLLGLVMNKEALATHTKFVGEAKKLTKEGKVDELLSETLWGYARLSAKTYLSFFGKNA